MKINLNREAMIDRTRRVEMLETMFEVPTQEKLSVHLGGQISLEERPWQIGLIVGPSGSGKTLLLEELFGKPSLLEWTHKSVIDDFDQYLSMEDISRVCQSVGFNTIPAWMRPYSVLSNGEKFRVEVARRLLDAAPTITIDEFTSVVDRQVAQFASYAVSKYVRSTERQFVAASCHYDIIEWLQPDWILEPGRECKLTWRSLRPRPPITVSVSRVKYETWKLFRDFHYMSQDLNKAARCYGIFVEGEEDRFGYLGSRSSREEISPQDRGLLDLLRDGGELRDSTDGSRGFSGSSPMAELDKGGRGCETGEEKLYTEPITSDRHSTTETSDIPIVHKSTNGGEANIQQVLRRRNPLRPDVSEQSSDNPERPLSRSSPSGSGDAGNGGLGLRTDRISNQHTRSRIASMCGILHFPHPKVKDICRFTRMVTLPDFQGLGLAMHLANTVAAAYKSMGKRLHSYPNHPAWIRSYQRNKDWLQIKSSGEFSPRRGKSSTVAGFGDRRCAVFMYIGHSMNLEDAKKLIGAYDDSTSES